MGKKQPNTPVSQIKNCFRMLSMRAREVQAVRKRDNNTCRQCGKKHSVAKGKEVKCQVHHTRKPNWDRIITAVREELLDPAHMLVLCTVCHELEHSKDQSGWKGNYGKHE
jgi:hypothetical protein